MIFRNSLNIHRKSLQKCRRMHKKEIMHSIARVDSWSVTGVHLSSDNEMLAWHPQKVYANRHINTRLKARSLLLAIIILSVQYGIELVSTIQNSIDQSRKGSVSTYNKSKGYMHYQWTILRLHFHCRNECLLECLWLFQTRSFAWLLYYRNSYFGLRNMQKSNNWA